VVEVMLDDTMLLNIGTDAGSASENYGHA